MSDQNNPGGDAIAPSMSYGDVVDVIAQRDFADASIKHIGYAKKLLVADNVPVENIPQRLKEILGDFAPQGPKGRSATTGQYVPPPVRHDSFNAQRVSIYQLPEDVVRKMSPKEVHEAVENELRGSSAGRGSEILRNAARATRERRGI